MLKPPATALSLLLLAAVPMLGAARSLAATASEPATPKSGKRKPHARPSARSTKAKGSKVSAKKKPARPAKSPRPAGPASAGAHAPADDRNGLSRFAAEQAAVSKAIAENWREQVADAERAARAPAQPDRWNTVLFSIRDLESRSNSEACFWRAVAYYHLGEIGRARKTREECQLAAGDITALDREDVTASGLQPPSALPELRMAGEVEGEAQRAVKPVVNPNPYAGPPPAHPN